MTLDRAEVGSRFGVRGQGGSPVALDKCAMDTAWRVPVASRGSTGSNAHQRSQKAEFHINSDPGWFQRATRRLETDLARCIAFEMLYILPQEVHSLTPG